MRFSMSWRCDSAGKLEDPEDSAVVEGNSDDELAIQRWEDEGGAVPSDLDQFKQD